MVDSSHPPSAPSPVRHEIVAIIARAFRNPETINGQKIIDLPLSGQNITDTEIPGILAEIDRHMRKHPELWVYGDFSSNPLGDFSAGIIAKSCLFTQVNVEGTRIRNDGLSALFGSTLSHVVFDKNFVDDSGRRALELRYAARHAWATTGEWESFMTLQRRGGLDKRWSLNGSLQTPLPPAPRTAARKKTSSLPAPDPSPENPRPLAQKKIVPPPRDPFAR